MPVDTVKSITPNAESFMHPAHPPLVKEVEELVEKVLRTEPSQPRDTKENILDTDEASQKWFSNLSSSCRDNINSGINVLIAGSFSALSCRILDDELKNVKVAKDVNNNNNKQNQNQSNQVEHDGKSSNATQRKNATKAKNSKRNITVGSRQTRSANNNNQSNSKTTGSTNNKNKNNSSDNSNNNMSRSGNRSSSNNNNKYRNNIGPIGGNFDADHRGGDSADRRGAPGMQRRWPSPDHENRRSNIVPHASMGHYHHGRYGPNVPPPYLMHPGGSRHQFPILQPHPSSSSSHYYSGPGPPPPLGPALGKAGKQYHHPPHRSSESYSPATNIHQNQHLYGTGYYDERQDHAYFDGRSGSTSMHHRGQPSGGYDDRLRSRSGSRTIGRSSTRRDTSPSRSQSNSHYREGGSDREYIRLNDSKDRYGGNHGEESHGRDDARKDQHDARRTNDRFRNDATDSELFRSPDQKSSSAVSRSSRDGGETRGGVNKRQVNEGLSDDRGRPEESTEVSFGDNESRNSSRARKASSRKSERRRQHRSRRRSRSPSTSDSQLRHQHSSSRKRRRRSRSSSTTSNSAWSDGSRSQKKSHRRRSERHRRSSRRHRNATGSDDDVGSTEKSITTEGRHRRSSKDSPRKRKKREKAKQLSSPRESKPEHTAKEHL